MKDRHREGANVLGLVIGAVVAMVIAAIFGPFPLWLTIALGLVLGALGWRYGDSFWFWILERLRYFVQLLLP